MRGLLSLLVLALHNSNSEAPAPVNNLYGNYI